MPKPAFDLEGFFQALDAERSARRLSWKGVADATGVSASTLTRLAQGSGLDVQTLAKLAAWAGIDLDDYLRARRQASRAPETMKQIAALLRADPRISEDDASHLRQLIELTYERLRKEEE